VEYLSHLFDAITLIRWDYFLPLRRLSGSQRDGAAATVDAQGRGTCGGALGDLLDIFKKATQLLKAITALTKSLSGPQLSFPPAGAGLRHQQQLLTEPAAVFDGGNGQWGRRWQWTKKTALDEGIGWGHLMVAVGFSGGDEQQQGGGKVAGVS
jgi:hypothetical protein